jgi:hypothetical protein
VVGKVLGACRQDVAVLVDRGLDRVETMSVVGGGDAVARVRERLLRGGMVEGAPGEPGALLVAPLGTAVPEGTSALLVRA